MWVYGLYNTSHQEVSRHNRELRSPTLPTGTQLNKPIRSQNKRDVVGAKRGKGYVIKSWLILVLHLIGWDNGSKCFSQSQRVKLITYQE